MKKVYICSPLGGDVSAFVSPIVSQALEAKRLGANQ